MPPFFLLVNGNLVREEKIDPEWSLAYFLREKLRLVGTKISCGQGACGACAVFISRYNKEDDKFQHNAANACVTPIVSVHGCHVTTIESLSNKETNTCHVFQEAIAKGHGTQCGYCIPGMVMSMYGMAMNNSTWDISRVKKTLQGNLCRCTGYRPILEAFRKCKPQSKASNVIPDIEDIDFVVDENCIEKQRIISCDSNEERLQQIEELIKRLRRDKPNSFQKVEFQGPKVKWFQPTSLLELTSCFARNPDARLVSGCTSEEFRPEQPGFVKCSVIQISRLKELHSFEVYDNHVCIGAGLTVTEIDKHLTETVSKLPDWKCRSIDSILHILRRFGSFQIRNAATIGGCLSVQSNASDLQTLANAFEFSALCFNPVSQAHTEIKSAFPQSFARSIIVNVKIPFTTQQEYTWAYKLSRRRFFDRAVMNVAIKTEVCHPEGEKDAKITKISMAFGGSTIRRFSLQFSYKNPVNLTADLFGQITEEISRTIHINVNTPIYSGRYLAALASNLFKKFYEYLQDCLYPSPTVIDGSSNPDDVALLEFNSLQVFGEVDTGQTYGDLVGRPIPHSSAMKHATGEARYCDDIPKYENELSVALVLSERAHAILKKVDPTKALLMDGVVGFLSHHDLAPGKNCFGVLLQDEEIFASKTVKCVGQVIGAIVSRDRFIAKKAAKAVHIEYEDIQPCIITIEDAITQGSYYEDHGAKLSKGDCEKAFQSSTNILSGKLQLGGQIHFYMETQSCIAVPTGEDGCLEIISATQNLVDTQSIIASALGLYANQITVTVKRVGGGFGGKDTRSLLVALPAALAAKKFGRPARCVLSRKTDMIISGKREPYAATYQIGFTSAGQLLAVKMYIYSNAGCSLDSSFVAIERAVLNIDNAYNIPNLEIEGKLCRSNRPSNTTFRGPGTTQGAYFIENILDRMAAHLGKEPAEIRQINMYQEGDVTPYGQTLENCTLERCWDECLEMSQYFDRKRSAEFFNSTQLYRKRGIYVTPCHFGIGYTHLPFNQAGALVNIYKDGSILLNHGGIELGQGIHVKMIQIATRVLNVAASKIRIDHTSTDKIPNTTPTSASLTSDLNGFAILDACQQLAARLEPYRKSIPHGTWEDIVAQAYKDRVQLSATGFYLVPDVNWNVNTKQGDVFTYFVSGAACSEVEVDCLTGEYQILRTDIVMDVGQSLNPAIDVGQIEGAFMQGVGLFTLEELITDKQGHLLTTGPLTYKVPTALDIPLEFNVSFLPGSGNNPRAVYSSKTVGEPPLLLANSVYFAIKDAVRQFRKQLGWGSTFRMDSPASVEKVLAACSNLSHFDVEHH